MNYEILDEEGNVINTIVADLDFVELHYPGQFRERVEAEPPASKPVPEPTPEPQITTLEE